MCGKNLYMRNDKIQMLRDQFMLSKKLYYSYLLNYTDEYWRNIYLKFKEKIRKTSMLVMTINNMFYKAHIKTNSTTPRERPNRTEHTVCTVRTTPRERRSGTSDAVRSSDAISRIHIEPTSLTNKSNKCIRDDNFMENVKGKKIKDEPRTNEEARMIRQQETLARRKQKFSQQKKDSVLLNNSSKENRSSANKKKIR